MSPSNVHCHSNGGGCNGKNHIKHQVSKLDTLAGVAIKYGVEVADIKRLNGLATDLQMFALKTLLIPSPGRHPPSPVLSGASASPGMNGLEKTPPRPRYSNLLESFESLGMKSTEKKVSPAMTTLQEFYGLKSSKPKDAAEGTEMAVYRTGNSGFLNEELLPKSSHISGSSYHNLKSRNSFDSLLSDSSIMVDYIPLAEAGDAESEKSNEKFVRRRQKSEVDFRAGTTERLLKEENSGGSSGFSPATGKGLAMRPKSASRAAMTAESEPGWMNSVSVGLGDSIMSDGLPGVHKSSSTPSLHDEDNGNSSSIWPTSKWSLKPDLQAFSNAAITIPMFDGLPKPITGRRCKAALD